MVHTLENPTPSLSVQPNAGTPLKFSLTSFVGVDAYRNEQFLSCEAARVESKKLINRLFNEQVVLRNALDGQLELRLNPMRVNCFDARGQFDHAVCLLRLNNLGPSRFLVQTSFHKDNRLICTTRQDGFLVPKVKESD